MKIKNQILGVCLIAVIVLVAGCGSATKSTSNQGSSNMPSYSLSSAEITVLNKLGNAPKISN
jgi:uncharacterized protein YceK